MGNSTLSALVIRCNKKQFEAKEIFSYLRIKAKLTTLSAVMLAVEDAGTYTFYLLRDLYYFKNVAGSVHTDRPFTISWKETPEITNDKIFAFWRSRVVTDYLNSNAGLDRGYTETSLAAEVGISLSHCMRYFVDPKNTVPRKQVRRTVQRNPFLKSATIGEMVTEMKRRGYSMTYTPLENKNEKDGNSNGAITEGQSAKEC